MVNKKQAGNYDDYFSKKLKDPEYLETFLTVAFQEYVEENDTQHFLSLLREVIMSQGGVAKVAKKASLNRENLFKLLNGKSEPKITTFVKLITALDININFTKAKKNRKAV
ncbi:MAG: hypothetical protein J0H68_09225 [Sphingobacteriia bacterium]|nr:hypothetical protein [Sphingobacteriia bacterium]